MTTVLIVLPTVSEIPLREEVGVPVGFGAQELVVPYHLFLEHGLEVDIATPYGKPATLDTTSLDPCCHGGDIGRALNLKEQLYEIEGWQAPKSLGRLNLSTVEYRAILFLDGFESMDDLSDSTAVGNMVKRVLARSGLVGALSHGQAALLSVRHGEQWQFAGYHMTCLSLGEEKKLGREWALANRLAAEGAELTFAAPGEAHVVIDRQLCTGQNSASAAKLGWEMARRLKKLAARDKASCGTPCG